MNQKDLLRIWKRSTDELVMADDQVKLLVTDVAEWDVPSEAKLALTEFGLPLIDAVEFVPNAEPGILPVRRMASEWYSLVFFGRLEIRVEKSSERVVAFVVEDESASVFVNSSVRQFVDTAWCYYWLCRGTDDSVDEDTFDVLDQFLNVANRIDSRVGADPNGSLWAEIIEVW